MTDECCTRCLGCGRKWCRDERPSPGEPDLCEDCYDLERDDNGENDE